MPLFQLSNPKYVFQPVEMRRGGDLHVDTAGGGGGHVASLTMPGPAPNGRAPEESSRLCVCGSTA